MTTHPEPAPRLDRLAASHGRRPGMEVTRDVVGDLARATRSAAGGTSCDPRPGSGALRRQRAGGLVRPGVLLYPGAAARFGGGRAYDQARRKCPTPLPMPSAPRAASQSTSPCRIRSRSRRSRWDSTHPGRVRSGVLFAPGGASLSCSWRSQERDAMTIRHSDLDQPRALATTTWQQRRRALLQPVGPVSTVRTSTPPRHLDAESAGRSRMQQQRSIARD
jgi:hypothetical protein